MLPLDNVRGNLVLPPMISLLSAVLKHDFQAAQSALMLLTDPLLLERLSGHTALNYVE